MIEKYIFRSEIAEIARNCPKLPVYSCRNCQGKFASVQSCTHLLLSATPAWTDRSTGRVAQGPVVGIENPPCLLELNFFELSVVPSCFYCISDGQFPEAVRCLSLPLAKGNVQQISSISASQRHFYFYARPRQNQ